MLVVVPALVCSLLSRLSAVNRLLAEVRLEWEGPLLDCFTLLMNKLGAFLKSKSTVPINLVVSFFSTKYDGKLGTSGHEKFERSFLNRWRQFLNRVLVGRAATDHRKSYYNGNK